jgi:sugar-specific transcriptional regulator TrmB
MSQEEPIYFGTWKGRVIKAIVIDGANTRNEIQELTGLPQKSLKRTLNELVAAKTIKKISGRATTFRVEQSLSLAYINYYRTLSPSHRFKPPSISLETQKRLVQWIDNWIGLKDFEFDINPKHFFLQGRNLEEFSKALIAQQAQREILVVNPFVESTILGKSLLEAARRQINVLLITHQPHAKEDSKLEFHSILKANNAQVLYHDTSHTKIIITDRAAAIVSSMNFSSRVLEDQSSSWEAGLITIHPTVIETIYGHVLDLQDQSR